MTQQKPSIYLAGTLSPNGWRHLLVQGFSDEAIAEDEFPVLEQAVFGRFDYVGPFHVKWPTDQDGEPDDLKYIDRTWALRRAAISKADVLFGWLEAKEAYLTLSELAFGAGQGKRAYYAISADVGPMRYYAGRGRFFPEMYRTFRMFFAGTDLCLSPRRAFAQLFNIPDDIACGPSRTGAVYFIESVGLERIKIGFAGEPEKRLRQLQTGSSSPLRLIGCIPGGQHLEAKLHNDFAHLRLDGEWFLATQELRGFIEMELGERHSSVRSNDLQVDELGNWVLPKNYVPRQVDR